jgi:hypothetical protein
MIRQTVTAEIIIIPYCSGYVKTVRNNDLNCVTTMDPFYFISSPDRRLWYLFYAREPVLTYTRSVPTTGYA